ncbi:MAG: MFS general substrate transporter [Lasallia pustulata]|uniref:Mediator of RNA polymerase II transcription subunit 7 n=1 Tax=Lasallia pustulata TaxID=136370 RepID=A0A5M8Q119_9LECA|nr:MAG: MFS general substrate transporter [Lasallia pustulata]
MSLLNYLEVRRTRHSDELSRTVSRQEIKLAQAELASERKLRVPNPLKTVHIMLEKDVALILLYNGLVYTAFYDATASLPSQFAEIYGFNDLQIARCSLTPTPLHLRHLTRSILLNFLEFVQILATKPADYGAKWVDLRDLFLNAHHLINEYRPHQTRETLILMMEEQLRRGREEVRAVREGRERVEGVLRGLVGAEAVEGLEGGEEGRLKGREAGEEGEREEGGEGCLGGD